MSPTFSNGKGGKLYRYYVSAPLVSKVQGAIRADTAIRRPGRHRSKRLVQERLAASS